MKYLLNILPIKFKVWLLDLLYKDIAGKGTDGDTELAHINAYEANLLLSVGGSGTINKATGLREYKGGGGGSAPTTQTVNQVNIPPELMPYATSTLASAKQQLFDVNAAGDITGIKPYTPYSTDPSKYVAGYSPLQSASFTGAAGLTTPSTYGTAMGMTGVTAADTARLSGLAAGAGTDYARMATSPTAMSAYMNPYLSASLAPQLNEIARQGQIASQQAAGQATAAGAFGGTRGQLAQSEAQRNALMAQQQAIGQGYNQAYNQAQQAMQYGAGLGLQGQQAGLQGLGQVGQLAGQLGALGGQQLQAQQGILGLQNQLGAQQQTQQQNIINQAIQNYATAQQYPLMQLGTMMDLVRGTPTQITGTQTYQAPPSPISQLAGLGTAGIAGLGLYNAMNG